MLAQHQPFSNRFFTILFFLHLLLLSFIVAALLILGFFIPSHHNHNFHALQWFIPLFASILTSFIYSLASLFIFRLSPSASLKPVLWLAPCFTLAIGVLLLMSDSLLGLGLGILAIISSVAFSVHGCWIVPHLRHGIRIIQACTGFHPPKSFLFTATAIFIASAYSCFLVAGIGGARSGSIKSFQAYKAISIAYILISMGWTMQVIKNILRTNFSRAHHFKLLQEIEIDTFSSFKDTISGSIGTICAGSLAVPMIWLLRVFSKALNLASGESDEFMFSCNECYTIIASTLVRHGNCWGFVHVGAYGKGIVQASTDVWELFARANILNVVESEIANSVCFLSCVAGGSLSSLVGGIWAFVVHKGYTAEVSVYAFLIGYFMTRIAMAWPQASVLAYYVAYSENPESEHFDGTVEARIQELQRYRE